MRKIFYPLPFIYTVASFVLLCSCQPVQRYDTMTTTEDTAEIKDCQNRLEECAEDNQALQDSITQLHKKR